MQPTIRYGAAAHQPPLRQGERAAHGRVGRRSSGLRGCRKNGGWLERYIHPWDYMAGALLVEEAGGRTSTFSGDSTMPADVKS